jgi:signal transduction histidine kinase
LTVIAAQVQLMERRTDGRSEADRRALAAVGEATRRARRLLEDLRDAARIGSGQFEVKPIGIDLAEVARRVVDEQQATTTRHRLVLEGPSQLEGAWDGERIGQVLTNLLSNAIKYSPDGGEVRLTLRASEREVLVSVGDHGLGIPPERQRGLFEPFSRLHPEHGAPGTGLGLYIVKGIAGAHGGRVWVESAPGTGSTFAVALPRRAAPARPAQA